MTVAGAVATGSQVRGMCGRETLANSRNYTYSVTYTKNKNLFTHHPSNEALRNACAACRWIDGNSQSQQRIPEPLFGKLLGTPQGTRVNECPATNPPFASTRGRADMQPSETEFKPGDVVRYASERDNRWCREGTAEAIERSSKVILVDTYWGRYDGDSHVLTEAELASAELVFNIGDYDELDRYGRGSRDQWMRYAPTDRERVTAQHGLQARWFIRQGAAEDLDTQIANAQEAVAAAQEAVRSAENRLKWATEDLTALQAKRFAVSRG